MPLGRPLLSHLCLFRLYLNLLVLDVEAQPVVHAHVLISHPYKGEECNEIPAPVREEQFELRDNQDDGGYVVAEAIFTREKIKEFASHQTASLNVLSLAKLTRLAKYLLMCHRPRDASHRNRE